MWVARIAPLAVAVATSLLGVGLASGAWALQGRADDADGMRQRAEALAGAASKRFDELIPGLKGLRLAQTTPPSKARERPPESSGGFFDDVLGPARRWFSRAAREYRNMMRGLSREAGSREVAKAPAKTAPPARPQDTSSGIPVIDPVQRWVGHANRQYHAVIVRGLSGAAPGRSTAAARSPEPRRTVQEEQPIDVGKMAEAPPRNAETADAARIAEVPKVAEESRPGEPKRAEDPMRKAVEEPKAADVRKEPDERRTSAAEAAKRVAEEPPRKEAEERRQADAVKRAAEEAPRKQPEDVRQPDAAKRAVEEPARKQPRETRRADAAKRSAEEPPRKHAEDVRQPDTATRGVAEPPRKRSEDAREAKAAKRAEEARRRQEQAEERRIAEERRRTEAKRAAEEKRRQDAEERQRRAETKRASERERLAQAGRGPDVTGTPDKRGRAPEVAADEPPRSAEPPGRRLARGPGRFEQRHEYRGDIACMRRAGHRVRTPGTYIARRGDTIWRIAIMHYGDPRAARAIWRANRGRISDPEHLYPCDRIRLPFR